MSEGITSPGPNDVICQRGNFANLHRGNKFYRYLTRQYKMVYVTSTAEEKKVITQVIVKTIRDLNPPGRFLKRDPKTKLYYDIGEKKANAKVSQALREGAPLLQTLAQNPRSGSPESSKHQEKNNVRMEEVQSDAEEQTKLAESKQTMVTTVELHEPNVPAVELITDSNYPTPVASTPEVKSSHDNHGFGTSMKSKCLTKGFRSTELGSFGVESFGELSKSLDKVFDDKSLMQSCNTFENENSIKSLKDFCGKKVPLMPEKTMQELSISFNSFCNPSGGLVKHDPNSSQVFVPSHDSHDLDASMKNTCHTKGFQSTELGSFGVESLDKTFDGKSFLQSSNIFGSSENSYMSSIGFEVKTMPVVSEQSMNELSLSLNSFYLSMELSNRVRNNEA